MLGHRGCRIGVTAPEIYQTQVRAIMEAAELERENITVIPEIMIPLVSTAKELEITRQYAQDVAENVLERYQCALDYKIGTMIEIPSAALKADEVPNMPIFSVLVPMTSHNSPMVFS